MTPRILIALYLSAIVAANLLVAAYGPAVSIVNAFVFIGLDLVTRDALHDVWRGSPWRLGLLIAAGGALSAALNLAALPIAIASSCAFLAAGAVDALTYHLLRDRAYLVRVNGSNVPAALVDSLVFPALAFGLPLLWPIVAGQFAAKVLGGAVWSVALRATATMPLETHQTDGAGR